MGLLLKSLIYAVAIYYIWRIVSTLFSSPKNNENINPGPGRQSPPNNRKKSNEDEEYVDYEEIK